MAMEPATGMSTVAPFWTNTLVQYVDPEIAAAVESAAAAELAHTNPTLLAPGHSAPVIPPTLVSPTPWVGNPDCNTPVDFQQAFAQIDEQVLPLGKQRMLGDYELLEEIARGGMGVVFKARQTKLNRIVAVKMVLAGSLADSSEIASLRAEAELTAQLNHPNIVAIHEVGEFEGRHYFSMDYVEGRSLANLIRLHTLRPAQAAHVVRTLAVAIEHAHSQGVLHRDLKPSNVLVDRQGQLRITDFGIAKRIKGSGLQTTTGRVLGTPSYMPPEQAGGRHEQVGPPSDVYGLGAILYEILTGRPPFHASSALDVLLQVQHADPPRLTLINPKVPRDLQTICLKCLAKDPRGRYSSAQALADDLQRWLEGRTIAARPVTGGERIVKWARRRPACAAMALSCVLAVMALILGGLGYHARLAEAKGRLEAALDLAQTEQQRATEQHALAEAEAEAHDAQRALAEQRSNELAERELALRRHLYAMHLVQVEQAWATADLDRVRELLTAQKPQGDQPDLRGFEWHYYQQLSRSDLKTLRGHVAPLTSVATSSDGRWLATAGQDGSVRLWNRQERTLRAVLNPQAGELTAVAFSGDAQSLVAGTSAGSVLRWSLAALDAPPRQWVAHAESVTCLAFQPGTDLLLTGGRDGGLLLWQKDGSEPVAPPPGHAGSVSGACFSPDGRQVAAAADLVAYRWDLTQPDRPTQLNTEETPVQRLAFTPDGSSLIGGGPLGVLRRWELPSGICSEILPLDQGPIQALAISPNGKLLAVGTGERLLTLVDFSAWEPLSTLRGHSQGLVGAAFAPDGATLCTASSDGTAKIWDPHTQQPSLVLRDQPGQATAVALSRDGRWLATSSAEPFGSQDHSRVYLREAATGRVVRTWVAKGGRLTSLDFAPESDLLVATVRQAAEDLGHVALWQVPGGQPVALPQGQGAFNQAVFSPDGRHLAAVGPFTPCRIWELGSGQPRTIDPGHGAEVVSLAFRPGQPELATSGLDGTIRVWNYETQQPAGLLPGHLTFSPLAFAPNGSLLATSRMARPQSPQSGEAVPPGLVAAPIGQAALHDPTTGEERLALPGHSRSVHCLAFSPDGARLATGSRDHTIKLWDTATGYPVATLRGHAGIIYDVAFSADGRLLVSSSSDGTVRLWRAGPTTARPRLAASETPLAVPRPEPFSATADTRDDDAARGLD